MRIDAPFINCPHCYGIGWEDQPGVVARICPVCHGVGRVYWETPSLMSRIYAWWDRRDWKLRLAVVSTFFCLATLLCVSVVMWLAVLIGELK